MDFNRQKTVPSSALLGRDATEGQQEGLVRAVNTRNLVLATRIEPERPVAFPEGSFCGVKYIIPTQSALGDYSWPKCLVQLFKLYRYSDTVYQGILNNMSPKLQEAVLRICHPIDHFFFADGFVGPGPELPKEWPDTSMWQNSTRCGVQMLRMDSTMGILSGIDTNTFFTNLAGLHKEEFVNRVFNGDMNLPTSELRQTVKLMLNAFTTLVKFKIAHITGTKYTPECDLKPLYSRFSCVWGRGGVTEGVMTRTGFTTTRDGPWVYVRSTLVVVSPEEYEAVRATHPQLCEEYLIPVVGSKSAQELMDPRLLVEESFAYMNSCPEGRAQMDKLADVLLDRFRFMFDFLEERNLVPEPPTAVQPLAALRDLSDPLSYV